MLSPPGKCSLAHPVASYLTLLVSIDLQVLQRVVDAIFAAPHVHHINGQENIPLGASDIRLAM